MNHTLRIFLISELFSSEYVLYSTKKICYIISLINVHLIELPLHLEIRNFGMYFETSKQHIRHHILYFTIIYSKLLFISVQVLPKLRVILKPLNFNTDFETSKTHLYIYFEISFLNYSSASNWNFGNWNNNYNITSLARLKNCVVQYILKHDTQFGTGNI